MPKDIALKLQQPGTVGVIATDTIYGLVARAHDRAAVARLYKLKHREHKPGTVIASSVDQLIALGLKPRYVKAVAQFWPGAVSVIIPSGPELNYLHQGKNGLAVRIPNHANLRALLEKTGPLLTSSANLPGESPANTIDQAKAYFGQDADFYEDGGDLSNHSPSTVVRIIDDAIEILRQGAVTIDTTGKIIE